MALSPLRQFFLLSVFHSGIPEHVRDPLRSLLSQMERDHLPVLILRCHLQIHICIFYG